MTETFMAVAMEDVANGYGPVELREMWACFLHHHFPPSSDFPWPKGFFFGSSIRSNAKDFVRIREFPPPPRVTLDMV